MLTVVPGVAAATCATGKNGATNSSGRITDRLTILPFLFAPGSVIARIPATSALCGVFMVAANDPLLAQSSSCVSVWLDRAQPAGKRRSIPGTIARKNAVKGHMPTRGEWVPRFRLPDLDKRLCITGEVRVWVGRRKEPSDKASTRSIDRTDGKITTHRSSEP